MAYNTRPGNIKSPYVVVVGNSLPKWIIIVKMVATWPFSVYGVDGLMLMPNYHQNCIDDNFTKLSKLDHKIGLVQPLFNW